MSLDRFKQRAALVQQHQGVVASAPALAAKLAEKQAQQPPVAVPRNRLQELQQQATGELHKYAQYAEIMRICNMPICHPMTPEEVEAYSRMNIQGEAFERDGFRFFKPQAEAICAYEQCGGLFGPIGVGFGKTLVTLAIASKGYTKGLRKMLLLVPSEVFYQLVEIDIKWARRRIAINYPIFPLGGKTISQRRLLATSGKKGLYIMPYSLLSTKDTDEVLNAIAPELIIADEAHRISNEGAARTKRVTRYLERRRPELVVLSGTITSKSIRDYYHLIRHALPGNNPLPNSTHLANEWAVVLDANATSVADTGSVAQAGPLVPLIEWARRNFPSHEHGEFPDTVAGFRKAYRFRLDHTMGVVSSGDAELGTSLIIQNAPVEAHQACEGWDRLKELIDKIEYEWKTPNDDEIEHAIHKFKWLYELSAGFYNELTWPSPESVAKRKHLSDADAEDIVERAKQHHAAGQAYASRLRKWLQEDAKPGLDTPFLVGSDMHSHGDKNVDSELYQLWLDWKQQDFEGRPERDSRAIRICPFKINAAVEWAKSLPKGEGAILWVYHREVGEWLTEAMTVAGLNVMHCPAGAQYNEALADHSNVTKMVVASMTAHGTGKNLQHFQNQRFIQWPRSSTMAEQTLGRLHRKGQKADELFVSMSNTLEFDELVFAACLNDALYIHQTTGNRQKLIYAAYDPLPRIFPPAVLIQRGLEAKMLTDRQRAMLEDKFGSGGGQRYKESDD